MDILAAQVGGALKSHGLKLATAESCTGGGVAHAITDVAGSSAWFERGFITYSNLAKQQMLGVSEATLMQHGAVSEAVVREMVTGALANSAAQVALAVSGNRAEVRAQSVHIALQGVIDLLGRRTEFA